MVASDGFLFVAVPDASTVTDRLYRWLAGGPAPGGGHVNAFTSADETARRIEKAVGLPLCGYAGVVLFAIVPESAERSAAWAAATLAVGRWV